MVGHVHPVAVNRVGDGHGGMLHPLRGGQAAQVGPHGEREIRRVNAAPQCRRSETARRGLQCKTRKRAADVGDPAGLSNTAMAGHPELVPDARMPDGSIPALHEVSIDDTPGPSPAGALLVMLDDAD